MSVRAYKIIEIKTEKAPTFNCGHDQHIVELGQYEGDILTLQRPDIEQRIKELEQDIKDGKIYIDASNGDTQANKDPDNDNQETTESAVKILKDILKDMDKEEDGYAEYYCY